MKPTTWSNLNPPTMTYQNRIVCVSADPSHITQSMEEVRLYDLLHPGQRDREKELVFEYVYLYSLLVCLYFTLSSLLLSSEIFVCFFLALCLFLFSSLFVSS